MVVQFILYDYDVYCSDTYNLTQNIVKNFETDFNKSKWLRAALIDISSFPQNYVITNRQLQQT